MKILEEFWVTLDLQSKFQKIQTIVQKRNFGFSLKMTMDASFEKAIDIQFDEDDAFSEPSQSKVQLIHGQQIQHFLETLHYHHIWYFCLKSDLVMDAVKKFFNIQVNQIYYIYQALNEKDDGMEEKERDKQLIRFYLMLEIYYISCNVTSSLYSDFKFPSLEKFQKVFPCDYHEFMLEELKNHKIFSLFEVFEFTTIPHMIIFIQSIFESIYYTLKQKFPQKSLLRKERVKILELLIIYFDRKDFLVLDFLIKLQGDSLKTKVLEDFH